MHHASAFADDGFNRILRGALQIAFGAWSRAHDAHARTRYSHLSVAALDRVVAAGVTWCRADPIVRLGADEYQIIVSVPDANVGQIDDALYFKFTSPYGTVQETLFLDAGFNGEGEQVEYGYDGGTRHKLVLDVKHSGDKFPVLVEIYRNGQFFTSVTGTSDLIKVDLPAS